MGEFKMAVALCIESCTF